MPGVDVLGAVTLDESPLRGSFKNGSLKRHKGSPPRVRSDRNDTLDALQRNQRPSHSQPYRARENHHEPHGGRLKSWIQEPADKHIASAAGRPETPLIDFRDNFKSWIDDKALRDREFLSQQRIDPGNSPLVVNSLPILEDSPIRHTAKSQKMNSLSNARNVSGGSVATFTESRTNSFKTARENLSSDDETYPIDSPSLHPARQKWLRDATLSQPRDVALGLGLDFDDEELLTPKELGGPNKADTFERGFVKFDGMWKAHVAEDLGDAESGITARRDSDRKDKEHVSADEERAQSDSPTLGVEIRNSSKKEAGSRRRQGKRIQEPSVKRKSGDGGRRTESPLPSKANTLSEDALHAELQSIQDIQDKRLSQASTSSTVVEAMVYESSPPFRRPSLRHTGKLLMLDDALGDYQKFSDHFSAQSDDRSLKHSLRSSKNADQGLRESFTLHSTPTRASKAAMLKSERSNVVVVPDRRSSLQSSTNSSKRLSRTFSINSKPQSSRPTTAPENGVGYFDGPPRGRTLSVIIQQATPVKKVAQNTSPPDQSNGPPAAVAASQGLARTTSVTSSGMAKHYMLPQTPTSPSTALLQAGDAHDGQVVRADRSNSGDWTALRPTSALITPYSLRSHSSTPGTLEVNEATAISIYPHTNESILIIAAGEGSSSKEQSAVITGSASIGLASDFTPLISQPFTPSAEYEATDTSLQNPRQPPSPPGFKVIPPTPANAASSSEDTVHHMRSSRKRSRLSAPLASLRRAISARRYSESSIANPFIFTRTLSLRDTADRRGARPSEHNKENQLHPFWRPRTHWDSNGDSDSDSEFGNHGVLSPQKGKSNGITRKAKQPDIAVPNPKRTMSLTRRFADSIRTDLKLRPVPRRASVSLTFDILPGHPSRQSANSEERNSSPRRSQSLTRRIGGSLRLPSSSKSGHQRPRRSSTADWNNQPHYEFVPADQRQTPMEQSLYQPRNMGFQNLAERIERRRSLREESKREERRQVLKGQIKPVEVKGSEAPNMSDKLHPFPKERLQRRDPPVVNSWIDGPEDEED